MTTVETWKIRFETKIGNLIRSLMFCAQVSAVVTPYMLGLNPSTIVREMLMLMLMLMLKLTIPTFEKDNEDAIAKRKSMLLCPFLGPSAQCCQ